MTNKKPLDEEGRGVPVVMDDGGEAKPELLATQAEFKEQEKEQKAAIKLFTDTIQLFTSSIFARKHGNVYLDKDHPTRMYCSTVTPEDLFSSVPSIDDVFHKVDTEGIDLWELWATKIPLDGLTRCCINITGMNGIMQKCKKDFAKVKQTWECDPETNFKFMTKEENGKAVIKPILWDISQHYLHELDKIVHAVVRRVDDMPHQKVLELHKDMEEVNKLYRVPLYQKDTHLGAGVRYVFVDGHTGVSLREYLRRVGLKVCELVVGQDGGVIMVYRKCIDEKATTLSVRPAEVYFSTYTLKD